MRLFLIFFLLSWQTTAAQISPKYIVYKTTILSPQPGTDYQNQVPGKRLLFIEDDKIYQRDYFGDIPSSTFIQIEGKEKSEYISSIDKKLVLKSKLNFAGHRLISIEKAKKRIAGQLCDRATYLEGKDTITVFYNNSWNINYCPVAPVEGLALEYIQYYQEVGKVKFEAIEIKEVLPDRSFLPQTASYQLTDKDDYEREQKKIIEAHQKKVQQTSNEMLGKKAKKFILTTLEGKKYNSAKLQGKVIVLNFWFVNCGPCRKEIPALNQLVAHYAEREDILFLGLALDPPHELPAFLEKISFDYQIAGDALYICDKFKVSNYPTNIVINKEGIISTFLVGYTPDILDQLQKAIEAAF